MDTEQMMAPVMRLFNQLATMIFLGPHWGCIPQTNKSHTPPLWGGVCDYAIVIKQFCVQLI
jgi:hypothetical protein